MSASLAKSGRCKFKIASALYCNPIRTNIGDKSKKQHCKNGVLSGSTDLYEQ